MKTYFEARRRLAAFALALPLACLALGLMISAAFAGDDTVVHVGPLFKALVEPAIQSFVAVVVAVALAYATRLLKTKTGIELDADARKRVQDAAMNAAGMVLAKIDGPVSNLSFDVKHPLVKEGVDLLMAKVPDALERFGITPEKAAEMILGKIGILQASAPVVPAAPAAPAP